MPELPEVETTCRGLAAQLPGAVLAQALVSDKPLRRPMPPRLAIMLRNQRIIALRRRAKYILMDWSGGTTMLLHLGMAGRIRVDDAKDTPQRHDHLTLIFQDGRAMRFNDPRRFGLVDLGATATLDTHPLLSALGVEPFSDSLTVSALCAAWQGRTTPLKAALLDQGVIAGLGNIYACEALFYARLSPFRTAGGLMPHEIKALIVAIRRVLRSAIEAGGSSLRDYAHTDGSLGYFQNQFAVYDRAEQACPGCRCGKPAITRVTQSGRSTYFCPNRQMQNL